MPPGVYGCSEVLPEDGDRKGYDVVTVAAGTGATLAGLAIVPPRLADQDDQTPPPTNHLPVAPAPNTQPNPPPQGGGGMGGDRHTGRTSMDAETSEAASERAPLIGGGGDDGGRGSGCGGAGSMVPMLPLEPSQGLARAVGEREEEVEGDTRGGGEVGGGGGGGGAGLMNQLLARKKLPPGHYVMY
eukprot:Tamp_26956.p1 GENE.Tamp_26956~~Tamp_26956.p1  ORF type:complete len:186 (-),score=16.96 Tamp_26956:187-744(-)